MMGTKAYAEEVKKILDPCGVILKARSEPMHTRPQHQTLIKTQAGGHDTHSGRYPEVWSEHRRNLLQIVTRSSRYEQTNFVFFSEEG
jgi:hypothetical protein